MLKPRDPRRSSSTMMLAARTLIAGGKSGSGAKTAVRAGFSTRVTPSMPPPPLSHAPSPLQPAVPGSVFTTPPVGAPAGADPAAGGARAKQSAAHAPPPLGPPFAQRVQHESYDVTIVGGGMVGSALALALATNPATRHLRVVLIEAAAPALAAPLSPSPSLRVSAVTPRSAAFFERIGAWATMGAARVSKYTRMRVWHTMSRGSVEWNLREMMGESAERPGQTTGTGAATASDSSLPSGWDNVDAASSVPPPSSALGYIVENDVIQNSLWRRMQTVMEEGRAVGEESAQRCGLEVVAPIKIEQILPGVSGGSDWPRVLLSNEQSFSTRLLIGADGPNSLVKRYAGQAVESFGWDYNQRAVVATLQMSASEEGSRPNDTAFQRFLPTGPIAFLPCHDGYANLVWSTTPAHAKQLCAQLTPQQFVDAVNTAFRAPAADFQPGGRPALFDGVLPAPLAAVADVLFPRQPSAASGDSSSPSSLPPLIGSVVGPRLFFPLRFVHSSTYVSQRVALLGDAAHVIHPMAGQGVNLGFGDAESMAAVIRANVLAGNDLGDADSLRPFEDDRRQANAAMMAGIDMLGRTFQPQDGPMALARAVGLDIFNAVPAIKNRAAEIAMGLKLHDK